MSQNYHEEVSKEGVKEQNITVRNRQPHGPTSGEAPPARRSWRPCQINQDGELNLHHQHHEHHPPSHHHIYAHDLPAGPGFSRHRRRPPLAQGQSRVQSSCSAPVMISSRTSEGEVWGTNHPPAQQHRPAVTRYRRNGDPIPRLKSRQRQPNSEKVQISPGLEERGGQAEPQVKDFLIGEEPQDRGAPHQTPIAVVTPTHLCTAPAPQDMQPHLQEPFPAEVQENFQDHQNTNVNGVKEVDKDDEQGEVKDDVAHLLTNLDISFNQNIVEEVNIGTKERTESMEEEPSEGTDKAAIGAPAPGSEIIDLCSDTESAASLNMDGPPPLHSPTPPSSPDVTIDHFNEEPSMSPVPENDQPDDEDRRESTSCSDLYPKTYGDFYLESHQKSCPESMYKMYTETKPYPTSFPEPFNPSYCEVPRDPSCQPNQKTCCENQCHQETFLKQTEETLNKVSTFPHTKDSSPAHWQVKNCDSYFSPPDHSVGCRLHYLHYDEESDEDSSGGRSFGQKNVRSEPGRSECQNQSLLSVQNSSGDAISLAIKDIKEAIEDVKTKTVPSPFTPDRPEEPIWVMRQEDTYSLHTDQSSSESESHIAHPVRENVNPQSAKPCRSTHPPDYQQPQLQHQLQLQNQHQNWPTQEQQRDTLRSPLMCQLQQQQQTEHQHPPFQRHHKELHDQPETPPARQQHMSVQDIRRSLPSFPTFVDVLGPCDAEDLIDGIIFAATYLGCTHLLSERMPSKSIRMQQAQEAMSTVRTAQKRAKNKKRSPDAEVLSITEVDLFMSTQRIKVLNADSQDCLMDLPLRTISYIADIGNMVVLMARGKMVRSHSTQENLNQSSQSSSAQDDRCLYRMICHVFESEDAQLIAQSIGQSFSVAYQEFLRANGIDPEDLSQREYSDLLSTQDMYNDDLIHFSKSENCRDVCIEKQKGEILGMVIVESGWGSILPTVIIASLMHAGPAEKSGRLNIGDQIMTVNGTSLVGLPLSTCQSIIKGLKTQSRIKLNIVRCPPVTMVLIRRPDLRYQLGFSVQNGIICSLMRGGIAERGGVRVGHRIIEVNSQSVVATPHEKIVQILSNAMGEIHMKTMPAAMYRLLTAQEQPVYI